MDLSLSSLSDDELHAAVRRLTARSNVTLADLLAHLGEVEERGIHRARACATLYAYCQYELRMSESRPTDGPRRRGSCTSTRSSGASSPGGSCTSPAS